jgi:hypothetical protein
MCLGVEEIHSSPRTTCVMPISVVVDDDGQVIGREPVGLEDDLVVGARRRDPSADEVVELSGTSSGMSMRTTGVSENPGSAARSSRVLPRHSRS